MIGGKRRKKKKKKKIKNRKKIRKKTNKKKNKKKEKTETNVLITDWLYMIVTQLYAFNEMNSLKGRVQNTEAKWNSKCPYFIFDCFAMCSSALFSVWVGVCMDPRYLWWNWTVKMEGAFLKWYVGNWLPVTLLKATWPHPRSWLGNMP